MSTHLDSLLAYWSTTELAQQMGVDAGQVSRWRYGRKRPRPQTIRAIGDALAALRSAPRKPTNEQITLARREVADAVAADHVH